MADDSDLGPVAMGEDAAGLAPERAAEAALVQGQEADGSSQTELLAYYRKRVDEFESERAELLERLASIEVSHEELHKLRWELRVKQSEIGELQRALSDANVHLFEEREQVLQLQAENDALKAQELEDRRRIQHLLALTQPVTQEVTFFRDCRPGKSTVLPVQRSQSQGGARGPSQGHAGAAKEGAARGGGGSSQNRVLRTVYLPSEQGEALQLTVQSLQRQLDGQMKLAKDKEQALLEDRRLRREEENVRAAAARQKEADLQKGLEETQETLRRTTGDYLQLRRVHQREQRRTHEETAALRSRNQQLVSELERMRQAAVEDAENVRRAAQQQSEEYASQFRRQAKEREEDLIVLKEQYGTMQAEYERRTESLHDKLRKMQARYKALQQRRNLEFEGFTNDFRSLRQLARRLEVVLTSKDFPRTAGARAMLHTAAEGAGAVTARKEVAKPESSSELQHELDRLRSRLSSLEREILANVQGGAAGELPSGEAVTSL